MSSTDGGDRGIVALEVRVLELRRKTDAVQEAVHGLEKALHAVRRDMAMVGGDVKTLQREDRALVRQLQQYRARTDALIALFRAMDRRMQSLSIRHGEPWLPLDDPALESWSERLTVPPEASSAPLDEKSLEPSKRPKK
jgi:hypothetical protein